MRNKKLDLTVLMLVVLMMTVSVTTAQTAKYLPTWQELPEGFYYTLFDVYLPEDLFIMEMDINIDIIYGEGGTFSFKLPDDNEIYILVYLFELSNNNDAKALYMWYLDMLEYKDLPSGLITENTLGDESMSYFVEKGPEGSLWWLLFRNGKFVVLWESKFDYMLDESSKIAITRTLPSIVDTKLERAQISSTVYTSTPMPVETPALATPTPKEPGFEALLGLLAAAFTVIAGYGKSLKRQK